MTITPKKLLSVLLRISLFGIVLGVFAVGFLLWSHDSIAEGEMVWGVNFSESQAVYLGLDPAETYTAIIKELGAKHIKIHVNWNITQKDQYELDFRSLDRMVDEAEANGVKLILVIGMKTGRWPECHTPDWFLNTPADDREKEIVRYISTIVGRYKSSEAIEFWQVENEPLLQFGTCPDWYYDNGTDLLEAEVAAVRSLDPSRKIIISDTGELSTWADVAKIGDIVGVTMYRSSWDATEKTFGVNPYTFLSPQFYSAKASYIETMYKKPVISIELQAEPWASQGLAEAPLSEQALSMNPELFRENIQFAREAGLGGYYFWGAEWWYWMKTKHNQPEIWNEASTILQQ
jgi:Cellulase (glycosyl hydrolase family 5)